MASSKTVAKTPRKTRAKQDIPENETKNEKFARIARARVSKTIKSIRSLKKLSGSNYERTAEQVAKIVTTLKSEIDALATALAPGSRSAKDEVNFTL